MACADDAPPLRSPRWRGRPRTTDAQERGRSSSVGTLLPCRTRTGSGSRTSSPGTQPSRSAMAQMNVRVTALENSVNDMGNHFVKYQRDLAAILAKEFSKVMKLQNQREAKLQSNMKELAHKLASNSKEEMMREVNAELGCLRESLRISQQTIKSAVSVMRKEEVLREESESTAASEDSETGSTAQLFKELKDVSLVGSATSGYSESKDQSQMAPPLQETKMAMANVSLLDAVEDFQTILKRLMTTVNDRESTVQDSTVQDASCKELPKASDVGTLSQPHSRFTSPLRQQSMPGSACMSPMVNYRSVVALTSDTPRISGNCHNRVQSNSYVANTSPSAVPKIACLGGSGALPVGGPSPKGGSVEVPARGMAMKTMARSVTLPVANATSPSASTRTFLPHPYPGVTSNLPSVAQFQFKHEPQYPQPSRPAIRAATPVAKPLLPTQVNSEVSVVTIRT